MAAVSDVLPSPGAPTTVGTTACTGPSRAMLPVVAPTCAAAGCLAAAVRFGSPCEAAAGCALMLEGCAATLEANGPWPLWVGSQAMKELAALLAIDCPTWGVKAAHGSLAPLAGTT